MNFLTFAWVDIELNKCPEGDRYHLLKRKKETYKEALRNLKLIV